MRSAYGEPEPKPENEKDPFERDRRLEAGYDYARDMDSRGESCLSTLAFVSAYRNELAEQYNAWRRQHPDGSGPEEALRRWEASWFGAALERAAHGMLWFEVRRLIHPSDWRYESLKDKPRAAINRAANLTDAQRKDRMLTALDKVAEAKAMPGLRLDVDRA